MTVFYIIALAIELAVVASLIGWMIVGGFFGWLLGWNDADGTRRMPP